MHCVIKQFYYVVKWLMMICWGPIQFTEVIVHFQSQETFLMEITTYKNTEQYTNYELTKEEIPGDGEERILSQHTQCSLSQKKTWKIAFFELKFNFNLVHNWVGCLRFYINCA